MLPRLLLPASSSSLLIRLSHQDLLCPTPDSSPRPAPPLAEDATAADREVLCFHAPRLKQLGHQYSPGTPPQVPLHAFGCVISSPGKALPLCWAITRNSSDTTAAFLGLSRSSPWRFTIPLSSPCTQSRSLTWLLLYDSEISGRCVCFFDLTMSSSWNGQVQDHLWLFGMHSSARHTVGTQHMPLIELH